VAESRVEEKGEMQNLGGEVQTLLNAIQEADTI